MNLKKFGRRVELYGLAAMVSSALSIGIASKKLYEIGNRESPIISKEVQEYYDSLKDKRDCENLMKNLNKYIGDSRNTKSIVESVLNEAIRIDNQDLIRYQGQYSEYLQERNKHLEGYPLAIGLGTLGLGLALGGLGAYTIGNKLKRDDRK